MSFDVSTLEAHVSGRGKEFAKKAVAGSKTAKLLMDNGSVVLGAKGDNQIPTLDVNADLQDGSVAGRNASGNTTFAEKLLKIARFKSQHNYRADDLYDTYLIEYVAKGQDPESETLDTDIINAIMERRGQKIAAAIETRLWTGTVGSQLIDGILTQLASGTITVTAYEVGATIIEKLQSTFNDVPVEITEAEDFRIFVGPDTHRQYKSALWAANNFNQESQDTLAAYGAKFEVVPGLKGTNKAVFSRISNFKLGLDKEGDMTNASLKWSIENECWYMDFNFAIGVKVIFPEEVAVADLS